MRKISFWIWTILAIVSAYLLNNQQGNIPALGYLLSPTHGFWQQMEPAKPEFPAAVSAQLSAPVEVIWDSTMVPHVFAENDADLYFVQGYITASMRLWQMDFQTRAASGRISEVIGAAAIDFDKAMRRKGMLIGAQRSLEASMRDSLTAVAFTRYADGVNAYMATLNARTLPLEYKLLDMQLEPWSPLKSALLLEYMANQLNTVSDDIANTNFLEAFGFEAWELLFGGPDDQTEPIVNAPGLWQFPPLKNKTAATDAITAPAGLREEAQPNPDNGSNNWAVSPQKSASGYAMLANDPHLGLNLPSLWFLVHLNSSDQNVMGASLPGTPGIVIGFNERIAWGFTNAQRDLVDWYEVTYADDRHTAILVDGKPEQLEINIEEIKVKGENSIFDTLRLSPFGIIANHSELKSKGATGWAYRWIGQEPSEVAIALIGLNHGSDLEDYMNATNHFHSPAQNIIYADVEGTIGIRVQGKYLARNTNEGVFLRDGSKRQNAWNTYIPAWQNVNQFNPERGFISSANQYPVDSTYPYFIAASQWESYRNRRINQVLAADSAVTVNDMMALQGDNYNLEAAENLMAWLAELKFSSLSPDEKSAFEALINWNYMADAERAAPAYYDAWRDAVLELAWDELRGTEKVMTPPSTYRTFMLLKTQPDLQWWDIDSTEITENATMLLQAAYKKAIAEINTWKNNHASSTFNWAAYKATRVTHLTRQEALSVKNVDIGGNHGIVNATSQTHGPSWRQIVELKPGAVKAWGIYPGGQSGNPGSAYYVNWIAPWAAGNYIELDLYASPSTLNYANPIATTQFNPAP